jgi:dipeptide/tripeptide permease
MQKKNWKLKLGIFSIILSILVFISLLLIPFLKIDNKSKLTATTIIIIAGEILFWTGGILVGKELLTKYKTYLNPKKWFKKKMEEA